jgi:hypothetical protein
MHLSTLLPIKLETLMWDNRHEHDPKDREVAQLFSVQHKSFNDLLGKEFDWLVDSTER